MSNLGLKIILVGDPGVGKTSITQAFFYGKSKPNPESTIGAVYHTKTFVAEATDIPIPWMKVVKFDIWDTAGQERYRAMNRMYYRKTNGCICVFDVTNRNSFINVETWIGDVRANADSDFEIVLVANKVDIESYKWQVSIQEIEEFCSDYKYKCVYTSCETVTADMSVRRVFDTLAVQIIESQKVQLKSNGQVVLPNDNFVDLNIVPKIDEIRDRKCCS